MEVIEEVLEILDQLELIHLSIMKLLLAEGMVLLITKEGALVGIEVMEVLVVEVLMEMADHLHLVRDM